MAYVSTCVFQCSRENETSLMQKMCYKKKSGHILCKCRTLRNVRIHTSGSVWVDSNQMKEAWLDGVMASGKR